MENTRQREINRTTSQTAITHSNQEIYTNNYNRETGCCANYGFCGVILIILSAFIAALLFPFSLLACIKVVAEFERAVILRLGRNRNSNGASGPGIFLVLPCTDTVIRVDLRTISFSVPPQTLLSKDSVSILVDAVIYYRINSPMKAVLNVTDAHVATQLLAQTTLRNTFATRTLTEMLAHREEIAHDMEQIMIEPTSNWGIFVERVEIRDVRLPVEMQRSMAAEAEAQREARAKLVAAEGERNAARALMEASETLAGSPAALQLRYLQTLNTIAAEHNSTIVFPIPFEMMKMFGQK